MTRLELKLHQPWASGLLESGAMATVRLLAAADGSMTKEWWQEQKPLAIAGGDGSAGEYTVFDLPRGGYYGVDVTRPRGADLSQELLVQEGQVLTTTIAMTSSPHEYLGWQQFAGIIRAHPYAREDVPPSEKLASPSRGPARPVTRRETLVSQGRARIEGLYEHTRAVPMIYAASVPASAAAWELVAAANRNGVGWTRDGGALAWQPSPDPELIAWFRPMPDANEGNELVQRLRLAAPPPRDDLERTFPRWLCFETEDQRDVVSVPWAWWGNESRPDEEIRFLYDLVRPSAVARDAPGHLVLSLHDRRWFGLLEFLASGRLNRASELADEVLSRGEPMDALHGKGKGPLVAVAGGIVLIARARSTEPQPWDSWLENLCNWFPGIPDGAILLGCRRVEQARDRDALAAAYAHLQQGFERGLPYFSASIGMLATALSQIAGDLDGAEELRRRVAAVATRVDPDQPFTVLRV